MESILRAYFDLNSPSAYAGVNAVFREAKKHDPKVTLKLVKKVLGSQETYSLHKPVRKKFLRLKTRSPGLFAKAQMDLIDWRTLKRYNSGYSYILVCIDVFSRFIYAQPLKRKTPDQVCDAFNKMFPDKKPWMIWVDAGKEFLGSFKRMLDDEGIKLIQARDPATKCALIERALKTIKTKISKYFTQLGTHRWLDILAQIVRGLNHSINRSIGRTPASVTNKNQNKLWKMINEKEERAVFKKDDVVRIANIKSIFDKGYLPNFSRELYRVEKVYTKRRPIVYKLVGVDAVYYKFELQKMPAYNVKVIKRRVRNKRREALVRWKHDGKNSWVGEKDLV
jgi:hypothetical protein